MTQPAKAQEPSMEEILASIRRIIADDEGKPAAADKPAVSEVPKKPEPPKAVAPPSVAPVTKAPVMSTNPPVAKIAPAPAPKPAAPPAPAAANSQDEIDAMLAGLEAATPEPEIRQPPPPPEEEVFELTDDMVMPAAPAPVPPPNSFRKVEPVEDLE